MQARPQDKKLHRCLDALLVWNVQKSCSMRQCSNKALAMCMFFVTLMTSFSGFADDTLSNDSATSLRVHETTDDALDIDVIEFRDRYRRSLYLVATGLSALFVPFLPQVSESLPLLSQVVESLPPSTAAILGLLSAASIFHMGWDTSSRLFSGAYQDLQELKRLEENTFPENISTIQTWIKHAESLTKRVAGGALGGATAYTVPVIAALGLSGITQDVVSPEMIESFSSYVFSPHSLRHLAIAAASGATIGEIYAIGRTLRSHSEHLDRARTRHRLVVRSRE